MNVFLGLGSNLGNRQNNLRSAITQLGEIGAVLLRASPVIETPALLPQDAPWEWNLPFLNMAIEVATPAEMTPEHLRQHIANIQNSLGRDSSSRWSPRPVDIDILLWGEQKILTETLTIPHKDLHIRHFVLTPMLALEPRLVIPGEKAPSKTLLDYSLELAHHIPLWMGIANITPDSFSDPGHNQSLDNFENNIAAMINSGVNIIDIGGESTRPNAKAIDSDTEWSRVSPALQHLQQKLANDVLAPQISLDTRHPQTAGRAIDLGIDFINDVSGLSNPAMLELASDNNCEWIAMHSMSIPADPEINIPTHCDPTEYLRRWLGDQIECWDRNGIKLSNVIFDPGIGFGKDALQSLKLLQDIAVYRQHGLRVLAGHSRKSFLGQFTSTNIEERDMATIGAAMHLCQQGVDIIRVHNIPAHIAAYRGWSHLSG